MKLNLIPLAVCSACLVVALQSFLSTRGYSAGELEPPGGPGSTMVSLAELSQQVAAIQGRIDAQLPGGRVLAVSQANGAVSVWDDVSGSWVERRPGGTTFPPKISNDNVLLISSSGVISVWNNATRAWSSISISGTVLQSAGSNGNFFLRTANRLVAWNKANSQFSTEAISDGVIGQVGSEGSYLYVTNSRRAAVWTPQLGQWSLTSFSADLTGYGTDK